MAVSLFCTSMFVVSCALHLLDSLCSSLLKNKRKSFFVGSLLLCLCLELLEMIYLDYGVVSIGSLVTVGQTEHETTEKHTKKSLE